MSDQQKGKSLKRETTPTNVKVQDGGCLGWFVVLGACVCSMFVFGVFQAVGPIFVALQKHFNVTSAAVSWILSFMVLLEFGLGPVSPIFVKKIGYRMTVMIGSVVSTIGFFISAFTPNIEFLYFSIGILVGTGYSLIVPPTLGIIALFIKKRFAIANSLVVTGGGLGTIVFPPVIQTLIDNYGWRGAFILFSAMNAHMCVSAALFRNHERQETSDIDANNTDKNRSESQVETNSDSGSCVKSCSRIFECTLFIRFPSFLIFTIATFFAIGIGTFGSPTHFVARAESQNLGTLQEIALMTSLFGIGSTFGRLVPPPLMLHFKCKSVTSSMLYGITLILAGITNHFSVLANTYISYSIFAIFYGLFNGIYFTLYSQALKDILSPDNLTTGVGLVVGISGIGGLIGPICAGKIYDVTGNYDNSFHFYGAFLILGGLVMLLDKPITSRRQVPNDQDSTCSQELENHKEIVANFTSSGNSKNAMSPYC